MTHEEIIDAGWINDSGETEVLDKVNHSYYLKDADENVWLLGIYEVKDGFYNVMIAIVDDRYDYNEWENSETRFYGILKTKEDLKFIMRLTRMLEY